jgi:hypothetical protein
MRSISALNGIYTSNMHYGLKKKDKEDDCIEIILGGNYVI